MTTLAIEEMRDQLMTMDEVRAKLEPTENLATHEFAMDGGSNVKFTFPEDWASEITPDTPGLTLTECTIEVDGVERHLTKDALLEATSKVGLTQAYVLKTPANLIVPNVDYWYNNTPTKSMKLMASDSTVMAFTTSAHNVFSNTRLLDDAIASIEAKYGEGVEVLADYKFAHDLYRTSIRLIVPEHVREIASARVEKKGDDPWSAGISISNSLIGKTPLQLQGYMFAWWCTNGAETSHITTGRHRRKIGEDVENVYAWAKQTVDDVLAGMEDEMDRISTLPSIPLDTELNETLGSVFEHYKVPIDSRELVMANLVESDDLTAYGLMQAITSAANGTKLSAKQITELLSIGGEMPHALADRCESCHRF